MPTISTTRVIERLRTAVRSREPAALGERLRRFVEHRDEAALADLVTGHGPMVWGVCRRLLSHHNAEDAFQATFIVLVRKAASVVPREMVGNWLYGVAHQTALQARRSAARRSAREVQVTQMPDTPAAEPGPWADLLPLLDEELRHLPGIYRAVLVLCDLEGRTRKEVAHQLGVPEGTVGGRLARGRAMLAKRLTQRGAALSGGALAAVLSEQAASAGAPNSLVVSTIRAATLFAAGKTAATGAISVKVAALTEGVMRAMLFTKLKSAIAIVLMLGVVATGMTILTGRTVVGQEEKPLVAEKQEKDRDKEKKNEPFTAWGKEVGGVQAGLGFRPGVKRVYRHGETVTLVVRVRNVGKEVVKFSYLQVGEKVIEGFAEIPQVAVEPLAVTDGKGKRVPQPTLLTEPFNGPRDVMLAPDKEIVELYELNLTLRREHERYLFSEDDGTGTRNHPKRRPAPDTGKTRGSHLPRGSGCSDAPGAATVAFPTDPKLSQVVAAWPTLPDRLWRAMLSLVGNVRRANFL